MVKYPSDLLQSFIDFLRFHLSGTVSMSCKLVQVIPYAG